MEGANLQTTQSVVEAPFVTVTIGDYVFGVYKNSLKNGKTVAKVNAPNYVTGLQIIKINGAVNRYTLTMKYGITQYTDPNYIDKVLSSVSDSRKIVFSYGDCNEPSFIYKNEEALITSVTSNVDFKSPSITYTIQAISTSALSMSVVRNWAARHDKPSRIIKELVTNPSYGLKEIFVGMQKANIIESEHLIATDDKTVDLHAKQNTSAFDYLNYLVSSMECITDNKALYMLDVHDTQEPPMYGCYFTVSKVSTTASRNKNFKAFEVDVGYPTSTFVTGFKLDNNQQWTILYDYQQKNITSNNSYLIDRNGDIVPYSTNKFIQDVNKGVVESEYQRWWNSVTEFPVKATLEIKGLLRPASLMQYVKINSWFYGQKYIASGIYIITKQTDTVNQNGYRTVLELLRVANDDNMGGVT